MINSANEPLETIDPGNHKITATNFDRINDYYCKGYFIFRQSKDKTIACAVIDPSAIPALKKIYGVKLKFYLVKEKDLFLLLERSFCQLNTRKALDYLSEISPLYNAKMVNYQKMAAGFLILFISSWLFFANFFNLINNTIYLFQNLLKAVLFQRSLALPDRKKRKTWQNSQKGILPVYTIFVPLYKESGKLNSIVWAIEKLRYPKSKLDVKFILEADDVETIKALSIMDLPSYIHLIKIPFSLPRTKPKAMNYAMSYIKGEYLCVYDAEDRPDPDQLLKALQAFKDLPEEYVCVQARLNFYNANENMLTRFFSIEYSLWFEHLLKGLNLYDLPLTLGGTSNHFKVKALREAGGWDSYNVTEDADLGIRLYTMGYKTHMIDSETLEESPVSLANWLTQRIRWIKGFIQTCYVFWLAPKNYKKLGILRIFSIYLFVGFSSYSFFCMPWLVMVFLFRLNKYVYYLWLLNSVFSLSYVYISVYYIAQRKKFVTTNFIVVALWPFYFVLHTIAAYCALVEIVISPFKWNKTAHGISVDEFD